MNAQPSPAAALAAARYLLTETGMPRSERAVMAEEIAAATDAELPALLVSWQTAATMWAVAEDDVAPAGLVRGGSRP